MSLNTFKILLIVLGFLFTLFLVILTANKVNKKGNIGGSLVVAAFVFALGIWGTIFTATKICDVITEDYDGPRNNYSYDVIDLSFEKGDAIITYAENNGKVTTIKTNKVTIKKDLPDNFNRPLLEIVECSKGPFYWEEYVIRMKGE